MGTTIGSVPDALHMRVTYEVEGESPLIIKGTLERTATNCRFYPDNESIQGEQLGVLPSPVIECVGMTVNIAKTCHDMCVERMRARSRGLNLGAAAEH